MRHQLVSSIAGCVLLAALSSCGDDSAETSETIVIPPPDTVQAPPVTAPTTTVESNTAAPSTSSTTSTTVAVTVESAATSDPASAVQAAVGQAEEAYLGALRDPDSDGLSAIEAATAAGSPVRDELVGRYRSRVAAGFVLEPSATIPFATVVEGEVELIDSDRARATVCLIDSDVLLRRSMNAEGDEDRIVVNDTVIAARYIQEFVLNEGAWRLASRTLINTSEGESSCADIE